SNGSMFRDMSGLAGTQQVAQAGQQGAVDATTAAGQIASNNMRTQAQKAVAMAQVAADIVKSILGVGGGSSSASRTMTGEGLDVNQGRSMDARGVPPPAGAEAGPQIRPGQMSGATDSAGGDVPIEWGGDGNG